MTLTPGQAVVAVLAAAVLPGCGAASGAGGGGGDRVTVVAAVYPLAYVAERVGGARVDVVDVTPPGVEPHDLELDPGQVDDVQAADVVLYVGGGFQPAVERAAADGDGEAVDVLEAVDATGGDPHVWLDPARMEDLAEAVAGTMAAADPAGAVGYRDRAAALVEELRSLDAEIRDGLAGCRQRLLVTTHDAFGYLADRYGLEQAPLAGLAPEAEADPDRLAELSDLVRERGVTTVFTEELASPALAETLAAETGATTAVLSPLEGLAGDVDGDYLSVMHDNLAALRAGLDCP
jgi:zinc transport system substrate-binding protein